MGWGQLPLPTLFSFVDFKYLLSNGNFLIEVGKVSKQAGDTFAQNPNRAYGTGSVEINEKKKNMSPSPPSFFFSFFSLFVSFWLFLAPLHYLGLSWSIQVDTVDAWLLGLGEVR